MKQKESLECLQSVTDDFNAAVKACEEAGVDIFAYIMDENKKHKTQFQLTGSQIVLSTALVDLLKNKE